MTSKPASKPTPPGPARYRTCTGCGQTLDVLLLLPRRQYRCSQCGVVFSHHPGVAEVAPSKFKPPHYGLRMILAAVLVPLMIWLAVWVGPVEIDRSSLTMILAGSGLLTIVGVRWCRQKSRDAVGVTGIIFAAAGLGTGVTLILGVLPVAERANAAVMVALIWLAFGGMQLSRFVNRMNLPAVGPSGRIVPDEKEQAAER